MILFAVLAAAINFVAITYLISGDVETLPRERESSGQEGSNVNIVLNENDDAIDELSEDSEDQGSEETVSQSPEENDSESHGAIKSSLNQDSGLSMDIDTLPDLGSFSSSFSSAVENEEKRTDSDEESGYNENTSLSSGSKFSAEGLAGKIADQNRPEELAKAVKTVLKR